MLRLAASALLPFAIVACESTADLGHNLPADSGATEPDASSTLPNGPEPAGPIVPDATLAVVQARCADPAHGPVDGYSNFVELKRLVVGRWFLCDATDAGMTLYQREAGIEFRADGTWNLVRVTADGKFVAQHGIDNEGTWMEKYEGFIGYFQIQRTSDWVGMEFAFESGPRRMRTTDETTKAASWLVPIGIDTAPPHPR